MYTFILHTNFFSCGCGIMHVPNLQLSKPLSLLTAPVYIVNSVGKMWLICLVSGEWDTVFLRGPLQLAFSFDGAVPSLAPPTPFRTCSARARPGRTRCLAWATLSATVRVVTRHRCIRGGILRRGQTSKWSQARVFSSSSFDCVMSDFLFILFDVWIDH
jgi:hypothetical protein